MYVVILENEIIHYYQRAFRKSFCLIKMCSATYKVGETFGVLEYILDIDFYGRDENLKRHVDCNNNLHKSIHIQIQADHNR